MSLWAYHLCQCRWPLHVRGACQPVHLLCFAFFSPLSFIKLCYLASHHSWGTCRLISVAAGVLEHCCEARLNPAFYSEEKQLQRAQCFVLKIIVTLALEHLPGKALLDTFTRSECSPSPCPRGLPPLSPKAPSIDTRKATPQGTMPKGPEGLMESPGASKKSPPGGRP